MAMILDLISVMQIESLKTYCDLVESLSFTKSAQINGVTQSAVSQSVHALELHFGALLLDRKHKKFSLTREGLAAYEHAKEMWSLYSSLGERMVKIRDLVSGNIRVAAIYSIGLHDLPPYIKKFMQLHPAVNVHVEYRREADIYEEVGSNVVDLGLVAHPTKSPGLEILPLRKDPVVLICHPDHALARLKSVKLNALAGQKFVNFVADGHIRKFLDKAFRARGVNVVNVLELDNIETVKRAVEIDAGISIAPEVTVRQEVSTGTLVAVPFEDKGMERLIAVVCKRHKVFSPAMKQFIALLKTPL
jgi:LysR family transcriptional regulator, transcriptional activator of the cysJI operon